MNYTRMLRKLTNIPVTGNPFELGKVFSLSIFIAEISQRNKRKTVKLVKLN